jgi:hypothetical protein
MTDDFAPREASVTPGDQVVANRARQAIATFKADNPAEFLELVREFDGRAANIAVFGTGRMNVRVTHDDVTIDPGLGDGENASGAIYMETAQAIMQGRITPLQAYFRGDIIVRAPSEDLHRAYGFFVKFAELALTSSAMREHFDDFRADFT